MFTKIIKVLLGTKIAEYNEIPYSGNIGGRKLCGEFGEFVGNRQNFPSKVSC